MGRAISMRCRFDDVLAVSTMTDRSDICVTSTRSARHALDLGARERAISPRARSRNFAASVGVEEHEVAIRVGSVDPSSRLVSLQCVRHDQTSNDSAAAPISTSTTPSSEISTTTAPSSAISSFRSGPAPVPPPCPADQSQPAMNGRFCGPNPTRGTGLGPSGECTGRETTPPCGPGMIAGRYYAYTLPGRCDGSLILDGRRWRSELPPPDTRSRPVRMGECRCGRSRRVHQPERFRRLRARPRATRRRL